MYGTVSTSKLPIYRLSNASRGCTSNFLKHPEMDMAVNSTLAVVGYFAQKSTALVNVYYT